MPVEILTQTIGRPDVAETLDILLKNAQCVFCFGVPGVVGLYGLLRMAVKKATNDGLGEYSTYSWADRRSLEEKINQLTKDGNDVQAHLEVGLFQENTKAGRTNPKGPPVILRELVDPGCTLPVSSADFPDFEKYNIRKVT
jgi:hypothetical protein